MSSSALASPCSMISALAAAAAAAAFFLNFFGGELIVDGQPQNSGESFSARATRHGIYFPRIGVLPKRHNQKTNTLFRTESQ